MNKIQTILYNNGERLVPYVSHDDAELVRHRSSYAFFHAVIVQDLASAQASTDRKTRIADLGYGTGYGCALLCSLPGAEVTGIDIGPECEIFAKQYYPRDNVTYVTEDLALYIPNMPEHDYVVSRGVLEHVPDGLGLIKSIKFGRRIMIDVPYNEKPGNEYHVLTGIREDAFKHLGECEFFYEDLAGKIYSAQGHPPDANMIMVVISAPGLPKIESILRFPIEPITSDALELASLVHQSGSSHEYETASELLKAVEHLIKETDVVADIGCGIVPMSYFRPKLHFMVEPWQEYVDILRYRYFSDKSVVILRTGAREALQLLADNSVDSIFLLDVIEHLEKSEGQCILRECERVAREQVVIFTPLGFMPQHMDHGEADGWGLSGTTVQEHLSGWMPEDFSKHWDFHICRMFHSKDYKGDPLVKTYGAFYAIRNFSRKTAIEPRHLPDFRQVLPVEVAMNKLTIDFQALQTDYRNLRVEYQEQSDRQIRLLSELSIEQSAKAQLEGTYQDLNRLGEVAKLLRSDFSTLEKDYQLLLQEFERRTAENAQLREATTIVNHEMDSIRNENLQLRRAVDSTLISRIIRKLKSA